MSTMDLFLRVFVGVQVGGLFLIVMCALFHEFWVEVVKRPRQERKAVERLEEASLYVPLDWEIEQEYLRKWTEEQRFREMEW